MGTFVVGVGPLVNVLAHDVVPPDHRASFAVYERGDPVGKQHLHFAIIVEILFFHEAADVAVGFPRFGVDFVSAYVYVATWKQIENFVENILYELYYTLVGHVEYSPRGVEICGHGRGCFQGTELGIGGYGRRGVSRHFDFGDDFNVPFGRKVYNFPYVFLGIVTAMNVGIVEGTVPTSYLGAVPICSYLGESRIFFDFDTPPLIVGEMPVEFIHFQIGHLFQKLLYDDFPFEMACFVEHKVSPFVFGFVEYFHAGYSQSVLCR